MNPNIAMSAQPVQLNNPLDAYAKVEQIRSGQNQNALVQYQLAKAQRDDVNQNALNEAWAAYDPKTGNTDTMLNKLRERGAASAIPDVMKKITEQNESKNKSQKSEIELTESAFKQSRSFLDNVIPGDPQAPKLYQAWFMATQANPLIMKAYRPAIEQMANSKGMTYEEYFPQYIQERQAQIQQVSQDPTMFAKLLNSSKLGSEKFIEMNKPVVFTQDTGDGGRSMTRDGLGGPATILEGSEFTKGVSATDRERLGIQKQQLDIQQQKLGLDRERLGMEKNKLTKEEQKLKSDLPYLQDKAEETISLIDSLVGDAVVGKGKVVIPKGGREPHPGFGQAVGLGIPWLSKVHGTDTADFISRLDQAKGSAFMEAVQQMKGSGSLSNAEGKSATQAVQRMQVATSEAEFVAAARDFQNTIRKGVARAKNVAKKGDTGGGKSPVITQEMEDIYNTYLDD